MGSKSNSLNLVLRGPLPGAVIKRRRARAFMRGHRLSMLQRAAVGEMDGNARCAEGVVVIRQANGTPAPVANKALNPPDKLRPLWGPDRRRSGHRLFADSGCKFSLL